MEPHCAKRTRHVYRTIDSQHTPTYQLDTDDAHLTTTELDITSSSDTETPTEHQSQGSDEIPVLDTQSSPNVECLPFENFNPFRDIDYFQDFNPFQDIELYQGFNFGLPQVLPDEISETAENLPLDRIGAERMVPTIPRQDGQVSSQEKGDIAHFS